jgi:hypothetical protein
MREGRGVKDFLLLSATAFCAHTTLSLQVSDRLVAAKLWKGGQSSRASGDQKLENEARLLRTLRHRNIVMFHGAGTRPGF